MKTFYWEKIKKRPFVELHCFHTQRNENFNTTRKVMYSAFVLPKEVKAFKKSFEKNRRFVVAGGAWKPRKDATWSSENGRFVIDESQIMAVV